MSNSRIHYFRRENAEHYVTVKALKHHFNLNWGDIKRIVKEFKKQNPKPDVAQAQGGK